jgi:hypothetical protein
MKELPITEFDMVINMDVQDNGNILVEEENTIYEIDGKCMMEHNNN